MDKWQKETVQAQLNNEKAVLDALKESYEKALEDINKKTAELLGRSDADLSNVIYQVQYQGALKAQIEGSLAILQSENFNNVNEYLAKSYEEGFLGTMYNMQKQGIPLIMPIDQRQVVDAITKDTKLSSSLYMAMGKDITKLKKDISSEISRGISTGMGYGAIAKNVALRAGISQNNAKRIARTEGHRINTKATMDACEKAKEMGADVVKQWDATLDSKTRDSHRMVDGEIREIDEPFSNGLMYPSDPEGDAEETINCRCALLERARWAVDEDEAFTKAVKMIDGTKIVDFSDSKNYEEFKDRYWNEIQSNDIVDRTPVEIEFDIEVSGYKEIEGGCSVRDGGEKYGQEFKVVTIDKQNVTSWDELPEETRVNLRYTRLGGKSFRLDKGEYEVQRYVEGSRENAERDEIAEAYGGEYLGFAFENRYGNPIFIDFYQSGDDVFYSVGKAHVDKTITESSLEAVTQVAKEREQAIIDSIGTETAKELMTRNGDEWVDSMKDFHHAIQADGLPTILTDEEYDKLSSPIIYRGIAPQSKLRKDITTTQTTTEMADEFFNGDSPFPSRGVYGDGVAYGSPAFKKIALNYATNGGEQPHGGAIIEFKLKEDANVILYEDALNIFQEMSQKGESKLLFNPNQAKAKNKEVGKAMNALGYDAILKHNGDDTGEDFYVVLNRASLVSKEKYITKKL